MLFKPHHVSLILARKKIASRRIWVKPMAKVGAVHKAKLVMLSEDYFAKIRITEVFKQPLGEMTEADAREEGHKTLHDYKREFLELNDVWDDDHIVTVVKFDLQEEQ